MEIFDELEGAIDRIANHRAGYVLAQLAAKLEKTAAGLALCRVLSGSDGQSLRAAAQEAGISAPALLKQERRIKKKLELTL
jgi:hypothetical protein